MGTAPLDVQHLHERVETVVRRILVGNARKREGIPERMALVVDSHLLEGIPEKAGVKSGVVRHQRKVTDKFTDLARNVGKALGSVQVGLADARQALDKRTKLRLVRLHQEVEGIARLAIDKADERDFDYLVALELEPGRFQIHSNKIRNLLHFSILYGSAGNGDATKSFKTFSPFFTLIVSLGALQGFP